MILDTNLILAQLWRSKMSKVYVVVDEFYGTIADVNVYKNEPKNLKTIRIYELSYRRFNKRFKGDRRCIE